MDIANLLESSVEDLVKPIFDGSWVNLDAEKRDEVIELFVTLHKFVGSMRQSFDDTLTTEQAKGNLSNVEHIRKPRERKEETPASMADFLKKLTK
jgi:hypothetical protein